MRDRCDHGWCYVKIGLVWFFTIWKSSKLKLQAFHMTTVVWHIKVWNVSAWKKEAVLMLTSFTSYFVSPFLSPNSTFSTRQKSQTPCIYRLIPLPKHIVNHMVPDKAQQMPTKKFILTKQMWPAACQTVVPQELEKSFAKQLFSLYACVSVCVSSLPWSWQLLSDKVINKSLFE